MWREAGEGNWAEESAAISGEPDHNWREWETKRESQYPSSREFGFIDWVSEKIPAFGTEKVMGIIKRVHGFISVLSDF